MKLLLGLVAMFAIAAVAKPQTSWNAKVLGVQIGTSHMQELTRRLGRAYVTVGTHPESGRGWECSNGLKIWADGSFSDGKDEILDNLSLSDWRGRLSNAHNRRGAKLFFGAFASLDSRMNEKQVADTLKLVLGKPLTKSRELSWNLRGPHGWPSRVIATFPHGRMDGLFLTTEVDIHAGAHSRSQ